jgi:hypothetical protein
VEFFMFMSLPTNFGGRHFKQFFFALPARSTAGRPFDGYLPVTQENPATDERAIGLLPLTTRRAHVIFFWQNQARGATLRVHEGDPRNIAGRRCFVSNDALDGRLARS